MTEWYRDPETVRVLYGLTVSNGIVKKLSSGVAESSVAGTIGVLVTPSLYPLDQFTLARDVQPGFNSLIDSVSRSHEFLTSALEKYVGSFLICAQAHCSVWFISYPLNIVVFVLLLTLTHRSWSQCVGDGQFYQEAL